MKIRLPSFGLLYTLMLGSVLMPSCLIYINAWGYDQTAVGIKVHLLSLGVPKGDLEGPLIVVRLEDGGNDSSPHLYLNSMPLEREQLSDKLKAQLKYHAEWVVYVEADPSLTWGDAMDAMDIVRGTGARIVLLTRIPLSSHLRSTKLSRAKAR